MRRAGRAASSRRAWTAFTVAAIPIDVPNVYRWQASGRLLTLTKISDRDISGLRAAWLIGVWKRA